MTAIMYNVKRHEGTEFMKVSREQVAERREKILKAAGRLFRERGFEAVTIADVMKDAGLTHGAFYGHFQSKDDLVAQTLARLLTIDKKALEPAHFAASYLTPEYRDNFGGGCPTAGLAAETIRQTPEARAALTRGLRRSIENLSNGTPEDEQARRNAIGSWAAMVGAMILARATDDPKLSDEILEQTRRWITPRV
jgi:TetR/AcrR family transcriptional regulator, transcriptional repressor for nem operon